MNGSTGDPEPAPAGKQQDSINSSCYCPIRIINTSAVLHGKGHVVQRTQGAAGPVLSVEAAPALALPLRGNARFEMPAKGMKFLLFPSFPF